MKIGFVIPVISECDLKQRYDAVEQACKESNIDYDVIFAFNGKLNSVFSQVRASYIENKRVKAFKVDKSVNEHKLITVALKTCESYDATIIYSAKETVNVDVIKAFITSWKAGNKLVYLKKVFSYPKKIWVGIKRWIYLMGIKLMGVFKDFCAETDIQLVDQDVVKTLNQLPAKNRHLRTLDSFIGYNYDIIKMEVDSKMKDSKHYLEKTKVYKVSKFLSAISLILSLAAFIFGILIPVLNWKVGGIWQVVIWFVFLAFGVLSLVYFTRMQLALRVGNVVDEKEIDDLIKNLEKYNF